MVRLKCIKRSSEWHFFSLYKKIGSGGTLEFIQGESPSGSTHAKLSGRTADWSSILQYIDISPDDAGLELATSFYIKIDDNAVSDWVPSKISSLSVSWWNNELIFRTYYFRLKFESITLEEKAI